MAKRTRHTLLFLFLFISACTVYYNTSDIKKTFAQSEKDAQKISQKIVNDLQEKQAIHDQLIQHTSDPMLTPYPSLGEQLNKMKTKQEQVVQSFKMIQAIEAEFSTLTKGVKKIESNSKLWDKTKQIRTRYDQQTTLMQAQIEAYNKRSNAFVELLNKHKISKLKTDAVTSQVKTYLKQLDRNIKDIDKQVNRRRTELISAKKEGASAKQLDKATGQLAKADNLIRRISDQRNSLDLKIKRFEKEVGGRSEIWSGPGMETYTIIADMKTIEKQISHLADEFNAL